MVLYSWCHSVGTIKKQAINMKSSWNACEMNVKGPSGGRDKHYFLHPHLSSPWCSPGLMQMPRSGGRRSMPAECGQWPRPSWFPSLLKGSTDCSYRRQSQPEDWPWTTVTTALPSVCFLAPEIMTPPRASEHVPSTCQGNVGHGRS